MDIIEFAMRMEKDGKAFYEKQVVTTSNPQLKAILIALAEEEGRHYEYFRRLKENPDDFSGAAELRGTKTLENVKNVFEVMSQISGLKPFGEDVISVWTEALRIEEKSESFYREKSGEEADAKKRRLLLKIASEEKNHIHMIDGVLTFLRYPETFAESAQFKNFRSLEGLG
jgi:rubrerythrin